MSLIATVDSLWRYPVKSMRGEELEEMFVSSSGAAGDRLFAFTSSVRPETFPFFTAREQPQMLTYRPHLHGVDSRGVPTNTTTILAAEPLIEHSCRWRFIRPMGKHLRLMIRP
jgi:MOSC domain-containing protein